MVLPCRPVPPGRQLLQEDLPQVHFHHAEKAEEVPYWVEAKILAGRNRLGQAERAFREVREGFVARGEKYDASLVGLELAGVLLAGKGRDAEVQELAAEIYEVFRRLDIHREAVQAMRYFREACRRNEATPALVRQIVDFVRRLDWHPHLRFAPAAAG